MQDDYSDILGTGALNVKPKSSIPFAVKAAFVAFALLVLYVVGLNVWSKFLKWRERSYRLAMRRKHGIPDDDHRPFNVAYAAAQRARQEREALRSAKSRPMNNIPREQTRPSAQLGQDLRQRTGIGRNVETARMGDRIGAIPGAYRQPTPQNIAVGLSRYNQIINGQPAVYLNDEKVIYPRATELVSHTNYASQGSARVLRGQKGHDGNARRRNHVYMDIDEGSAAAENSDGRQAQSTAPKRGSKREFGDADETEDVLASKRAREKRARKVSLENELSDGDMEVDENELSDGVDRGRISRGKKRDRDEAGSTFGCDDEDQSELEDIQDDDETRPRSRKRRSVVKKKSDLAVAIRGKKRDRDLDDELSEDTSDQASNQTSSRKRRNKREGRLDEYLNGDISMDDSPVKGKLRKIGEEWTSNGVMYKIGPNGQRLRQTLVKRARQKYSMPEDSQHPDRDANLEVYVETWLTEDEYQDAKEQQLLAWQDSPKASVERGAPPDHTQPPPSPSGKSLLWKSPAVSTPEGGSPTSEMAPIPILKPKGRVAHDSRRQSIAVDVALRINPFQQYPLQTNRRIASGSPRIISGASSPGLVDSTNSSPRSLHRVYSKWEKQDLEASAMMKMREAARKKESEEKERLEKDRLEKERVEREKAEKEKAAAAPPVPTITVTKPPEDKPVQSEQKVPEFFAKPPEPAKEAAKPAVQPSPFSFKAPEAKTAAPVTPAPSFPGVATAPSTAPFSFPMSGPTPFMSPAKPAENTAKPAEQGPKPVLFAMPQSSSAGATTSPVPAAPATPLFSFSKPAAQPEQKQPDSSVQAGGASLLSRLAPSSAPSTFSFTKPSEAPKSLFGTSLAPASATQPAQSQPATSASTPAPLKFDFKLPNKSSAPASGFAVPTSSLAPAATADAPKPAPTFSFKPSPAQSPAGLSTTTGVSKFTFGVSGDSFLASGASQASSDAQKDSTLLVGKSPFNFNPATNNVSTSGGAGFPGFGNAPTPSTATSDASSKPPALGTGFSSSTDIFGTGGQSSLGTKPAEPTKSIFNFRQTPSSSASPANPATSTTAADTSAAQTAAPPSSAPKFSFNLGGSNSLNKGAATGAAVPPFAGTPAFGVSSAPSSFGGGGSGAFGFSGSTPAPSSFGSGQTIFGSSTPSTLGAIGNGQGSANSSSTPSASDAVGNAPRAATSSPFGAPGSGQSSFGPTTSTQSTFGAPPSKMFSFGNMSSEKPTPFGNMASSQATSQPVVLDSTPTAAPVFGSTPMTNSGGSFSFGQQSSSNMNDGSGGQS